MHNVFPTPQLELHMSSAELRGRAQELLKGHVTDDSFVDLKDAVNVLNILQNAYGDPDPEGTARSKLDKLC